VAAKPKAKSKLPTANTTLKMEDLQIGQKLPGLVVKYTKKGATVKLGKHVFGMLHPTDASDNYSPGHMLPVVDSVVQAVVIGINLSDRQVALSTRPSRVNSERMPEVVDQEIKSLDDLRVGQRVRGLVKSVADSGLFVSLSRSIDARVQIKELFDEVRGRPFGHVQSPYHRFSVCEGMER
jgi:rRNA biogenesis protein RRP5